MFYLQGFDRSSKENSWLRIVMVVGPLSFNILRIPLRHISSYGVRRRPSLLMSLFKLALGCGCSSKRGAYLGLSSPVSSKIKLKAKSLSVVILSSYSLCPSSCSRAYVVYELSPSYSFAIIFYKM